MFSTDMAVVLLYNCFVLRGLNVLITGSFYITLLVLRQCVVLESLDVNTPSSPEPRRDRIDQVEVRALLIDCINQTEPVDAAERLEREELFKYRDLRSCIKKLALTVRLYSATAEFEDEYLPVEHVSEGRGCERVRLLNPYVLRLRRDPPLQAYRVRRTDTVSGTLMNANVSELTELKEKTKNSGEPEILVETSEVDGRLEPLAYDPDQDLTRNIPTATLENWSESAAPRPRQRENSALPNTLDNDLKDVMHVSKRSKRHEYNVVIEHPVTESAKTANQAENYNDHAVYDDSKDIEYKFHSTESIAEAPESLYDYVMKKTTQRNVNKEDRKVTQHDYIEKSNRTSTTKSPSNAVKEEAVENNSTKRSTLFMKSIGSNSTTTETIDYNKIMASADYALYVVGEPEIWHTIRIQLFEKTATPEGKTVWNDLTGGTPISIGSIQSEWKNEDLAIRYHPMEKLERSEFAFPDTKLRLLVPLSTPSEKYFDKNGNSDGDYIIVPAEDITYLEDDFSESNDQLKLNLNGTPVVDVETTTKERRRRRVVVQVGRVVGAGGGRPALVRRGAERYLTVAHRTPRPVQVDLEARADDNQLVRVGTSGSIPIIVADCTRPTRTIMTVHVSNTGLAAAPFRVVVRECTFESPPAPGEDRGEVAASPPELVPPRHTRRIQLELLFELPSEIKHCTVSLVNHKEKAVAEREVAVNRADRCFCVWHCDCVCLSADPKLRCREMRRGRAAAAGLTAPAPARLRQRSICYPSELSINISYFIIVLLLLLILPGLMKAVVGLYAPVIGIWGLDRLVSMPPVMDKYYEPWLRKHPVEYDNFGWPIHPHTKERTHAMNLLGEFFLNTFFCLWVPWIVLWDALRQLGRRPKFTDSPVIPTLITQVVHTTKAECWEPRAWTPGSWMSPHAEDLSTDLWQRTMCLMKISHLFRNFKRNPSSSSERTPRKKKIKVLKTSSGSGCAKKKTASQKIVSRKPSRRSVDVKNSEKLAFKKESESSEAESGRISPSTRNNIDSQPSSSDSSKRKIIKNIMMEYRHNKDVRRIKSSESSASGAEAAIERGERGASEGSATVGRGARGAGHYMFRGADKDSDDTKYVLKKMKESKKMISRTHKKDEDCEPSSKGLRSSRPSPHK